MANFLIIGVGGFGRGVCNHVKYEMELSKNSLKIPEKDIDKLYQVLLFDGPKTDDPYKLPGGFQVDTSEASREWYPFTDDKSPSNVIKKINEGAYDLRNDQEKLIYEWMKLNKEAVRSISDLISPSMGFGGHRTPGHAYVYMDIEGIDNRIHTVVNGLGNREENFTVVFLVGSFSGGTASGTMLDIAHVLRHNLKDLPEVFLISITPLANTYNKIRGTMSDRGVQHYAQNFACLLNLLRFMTADSTYKNDLRYRRGPSYPNATLFDVPFIVDGDNAGANINLSNYIPQEGIVPVTANFISTFIKEYATSTKKEGGLFRNSLTNWRQTIGNARPPYKRFGGFGSFSITYPFIEILDTTLNKYCTTAYQRMISEDTSKRGEKMAIRVLNRLYITNQSLEEELKTNIWDPKTHGVMYNLLKAGNVDDLKIVARDMPTHHHAILTDEKTNRLFKNVPDQELIYNVQSRETADLAALERWISHQAKIIKIVFSKLIDAGIEEIFYDLKSTEKEPYKLTYNEDPSRNKANLLRIAYDFTKYLKVKMDELKKKSAPILNETLLDEWIGTMQGPYNKCISGMEVSSKAVKSEQEEFLLKAENLLKARSSKLLASAVSALLIDLCRIADEKFSYFSDNTRGWMYLLSNSIEKTKDEYNKNIQARQIRDKWQQQIRLPKPLSRTEEILLQQTEIQDILDKFLNNCHWEYLPSENGNNNPCKFVYPLTGLNLSSEHKYNFIMGFVSKDDFDYFRAFSPVENLDWFRGNLYNPLNNKSIWDILDFEFKAKQETIANITKDSYAEDIVNKLYGMCGLLLARSGSPGQVQGPYIFTNFPPAGTEGLRNLIVKKISERQSTGVFEHRELLTKDIRSVYIEIELSIKDWNYYSDLENRYDKYVANKENLLIDVYINEQIANLYKDLIQDYVDVRFRDTIMPEISMLFTDAKLFKYLSLCYTLNLINKRTFSNDIQAKKKFYVSVESGDIDLADEDDIYSLFFNVMRPSWEKVPQGDNTIAQNAMVKLWEEAVREATKSKKEKELFEKRIYSAQEKVNVKPITIEDKDSDGKSLAENEEWIIQKYRQLTLCIRASAIEYVKKRNSDDA